MLKFSGRELYEMYSRIHAQNGYIMDSWDDLDEAEKNVWRLLAVEISE